jgi:phosphatidylserine/phosphatidylglycerophosphate/cardiolipin synthase-like enzyme
MKALRCFLLGLAVLALAGCNLSLPGVSPGTATPAIASTSAHPSTTAAPTPVPSATGSLAAGLSLLVEPGAGYSAIDTAISRAHTSIDLVMYELSDSNIEALLVAAQGRGVQVRVILDQAYAKSQNQAAYSYLSTHGVAVHWSSSQVDITHQKTLVTDSSEAWIMTGNLTPQYYSGTRDFIVTDTQAPDVAAIQATFSADWANSAITPATGSDLLWSPGSEGALVTLIASAKSQIVVENEEMDESYIQTALEDAAHRGVDVEVCMTNSSSWSSAFSQLSAAGVHVRTYADSASILYIHAKAILTDPGKPGAQLFVGSENLSVTSLLKNRELGVITHSAALIAAITPVLEGDFNGGTPTS